MELVTLHRALHTNFQSTDSDQDHIIFKYYSVNLKFNALLPEFSNGMALLHIYNS